MPQKIHAIYVLSPQISYDTKEQARTFDTLVLFVPYNEPYLFYFKKEKITLGGVGKNLQAAILTLEQNPPETNLINIHKKILSGGFGSKVKIAAGQVFVTPPNLFFFSLEIRVNFGRP